MYELEQLTVKKIGYLPNMKDIAEHFNVEYIVCTYNDTLQKVEYISSTSHPHLSCIHAIRMSCNLPILFDQFKYRQHYYLDGGIIDNFPLSQTNESDKVLGINIKLTPSRICHDIRDNLYTYAINVAKTLLSFMGGEHLNTIPPHHKIITINEEVLSIMKYSMTAINMLDIFSKGFNISKEAFEGKNEGNEESDEEEEGEGGDNEGDEESEEEGDNDGDNESEEEGDNDGDNESEEEEEGFGGSEEEEDTNNT